MMSDSHIVRLFGKGYRSPDGGHLGTRYFVDSKHLMTVAFAFGVDWVVESVTLTRGIDLPVGASARKAESRYIRVDSLPEGLVFGQSREAVRAFLGAPEIAPEDPNTFVYHTNYESADCVIEAGTTLIFRDDHLVSISLFNGE